MDSALLRRPRVAKKPKRNDVPVKIDAGIYRNARTIAAWKGLDLAEYLSTSLAPAVAKDLAKMKKELGREIGESHSPADT